MENHNEETVSTSPLLEYGIMKSVLQNLPNIQQLNKAARVCKSWNETAKIIKKSRHQIYYTASKDSHEDYKNIQEVLQIIRSQPVLCITFLTHANYDEIPPPLDDTGGLDIADTSEDCMKKARGRFTEYVLLKYLRNHLPRNCNILGGVSCGVVMSGPSLETAEVEDGNAYGLFLLPELTGVKIQSFYLDKRNMRKANNALSSHEGEVLQVLNIKDHENIKSVLLLGSDAYKESKCIESLCRYLQDQKSKNIAIGGGFVEAVIHPEVVDRERDCGIMGLVFSGQDVQATSVIVPPDVTNENDIENILKMVTAKHSQGNGKRKSIGFMFACVARGSHVHGRPGVESALFRKHFPTTPLVGFFGNGEIGVNSIDLLADTHSFRTPAYSPPKKSRASFLHSYSTVFVVISFPVE